MPATATIEAPVCDDTSLLSLIAPTAAEITWARRRLHLKAALIVALGVFSYGGLVFGDVSLLVRLGCAALLVIAVIATATSILHDGNHASFSRSRVGNHIAALSADFLGASSLIWRFKHNHLHHGNTNVVGMDTDIDQAPFARLAPVQEWLPRHRYQHVYLWFLYGFLTIRWFVMSDFRDLANGGIGAHRFPRKPRRRDVITLFAGKAVHATWALVIPLMFNPWWAVLTFYVVSSWLVGFALAVMFQVAHCVDNVEFTSVDTPRRGPDFASHQLLTTADVRCKTRAGQAGLHWIMGGLDAQVEHHLAPRLPHTIYPQVARQLRQVAATQGFNLRAHTTPWQAIVSHGRWLRIMGRRPTAA